MNDKTLNEEYGDSFPYLYNPKTGRVMVSTPAKRKLCPHLVPCRTAAGPKADYDAVILSANSQKAEDPPVEVEREPDSNAEPEAAAGPEALLQDVLESEDREFIYTVAKEVGADVTDKMNIRTLKARVRTRVEALAESNETSVDEGE